MKRIKQWAACACLCIAGFTAPASAQSSLGSCPSEAYITQGSSATTIQLYAVNPVTGAMSTTGPIDTDMNNVNAVGFRPQDGLIWGWNTTLHRLVKIGAGGVTAVAYPASRPVGNTTDFFGGDVQPSTGYYFGWDGTDISVIDVTTNAVIRQMPLTVPDSSTMTDFAFSPIDGNIYSINGSGTVFRINPNTGAVTVVATALVQSAVSGGFGGIYFDTAGTLYAYKSGSGSASPNGGYIYRVFNVTGTPTWDAWTTALTASNLDGARCSTPPPQVTLYKQTRGVTGGPFSFSIPNATQPTGTISTSVADTAQQVDGDPAVSGVQAFSITNTKLGQDIVITESLPGNWILSGASCTLNGVEAGSRTGNAYTISGNLVALRSNFICTFKNQIPTADLSITKTNTPAQGTVDQTDDTVVYNQPTTYTIVVTNKGPDAVSGAVLKDTPGTGIGCADATVVSCTSATPAACPATAITVGTLRSGVALPAMALNASISLSYQCTVQ